MNRFIIFTSFILVLSLHLVVFTYYKNNQQNKISTLEKNQPLQIQLTKAYQKEQIKEEHKVFEKKVEEKKPLKEKIKKPQEIKQVEPIKQKETFVEKETTTTQEIKNSTEEIKRPIEDKNQEESKIQISNLIDEYGKKLREEINKNKNYPTVSKKLKEQGKVIIRFKVLKNGIFEDISILISSNKERLDKAALNAVYDTKEFIPYDDKIQKEFLEYDLPLEFILN
jgi:protein TonB